MKSRHQKEARQEQSRKRKSFLPTLIATVLFWLLLVLLVNLFSPDNWIAVLIFFIILLIALLFTCSVVLGSGRRGLISAIGLTIFVILRYFGVGNVLNFLLIFGICASIEIYLLKR